MTDHSERRAEPFKDDECVNCHHPEGLHDTYGLAGCNWQPPFEYAAETCGCRNFVRKPRPWETSAVTQTLSKDGIELKCVTCGVELPADVERWNCTCGCGKSWCAEHGRNRKRAKLPGDKSYLLCINEGARP